MQAENRHAFKEWASICSLLARGRQSLILRKGGIHEGHAGFRVAHPEFWLFPTEFHQSPDQLAAGLIAFGDTVHEMAPPEGQLHLSVYCAVEYAIEIVSERTLAGLVGLHGWSDQTVHDRFYYREPRLFALAVRAYVRPQPHILIDSPHFGGCRSWVELPRELSTTGLEPAIDDAQHQSQVDQILSVLSPRACV